MFSGCPFVRPSVSSIVCCQTFEHAVLMPVGTSGTRCKDMNRSIWESGGQRSKSHEAVGRFRGIGGGIIVSLLESSCFYS